MLTALWYHRHNQSRRRLDYNADSVGAATILRCPILRHPPNFLFIFFQPLSARSQCQTVLLTRFPPSSF